MRSRRCRYEIDAWPLCDDDARRLVVEVVLLDLDAVGRRLLLGGDRLVVGRLALLAQEAGEPRALLLGDVRAVQADEARRGRRQEQHVALAEQLLGAVAVENRPRVDLRRHAERDARRQVRLDEPVMTSTDGRCVARIRWMPTARAICASRAIDSSTSLLATIIRSASSSMTTTMNGSGLGCSPSFGVALLGDRLLHVAVVLLDVADAFGRERLVALLHLADGPAQRVRRLLRIDDDRRQQVRDVFVHPELEPLGVDHDQPHVVGRRAVEDAREHRVDADRLAGAGRAGDEQVRHRRQVGRRTARRGSSCRARASASTSSAGRPPTRAARAARSARGSWFGNLDADGRLAGDAIDQDRLGLHRQAEVVGEAR